MPICKLWKGTIHKVSSSNLVIFRQPFTFVRFQTIEWCHKNNSCIDVRFCFSYTQRDTTYNNLTYRDVYFFRCGIFQGYSTWPWKEISLKRTIYENDMVQFAFFLYTDQMWRVEKNVIWKNIFYFVWRFLQWKLKN